MAMIDAARTMFLGVTFDEVSWSNLLHVGAMTSLVLLSPRASPVLTFVDFVVICGIRIRAEPYRENHSTFAPNLEFGPLKTIVLNHLELVYSGMIGITCFSFLLTAINKSNMLSSKAI